MPITVGHAPDFGLAGQASFQIGAGLRQQQVQDILRRQAMQLQQQQYAGALQANRDVRLNNLTQDRDRLLHSLTTAEQRYNAVLQADRDLRSAGIADHQSNVSAMFRERDDLRRYGLDEGRANNEASRRAAYRAFEIDLLKGLSGFEFGLQQQGRLTEFDLNQVAAEEQLRRQAQLNQQQAAFAMGRMEYSSAQQRSMAKLQAEIDALMDDPKLRRAERMAAISERTARLAAIQEKPWNKEGGGVMSIQEREDAGILQRQPDGSILTLDNEGNVRVFNTDAGQLNQQNQLLQQKLLFEQQRRQLEKQRASQAGQMDPIKQQMEIQKARNQTFKDAHDLLMARRSAQIEALKKQAEASGSLEGFQVPPLPTQQEVQALAASMGLQQQEMQGFPVGLGMGLGLPAGAGLGGLPGTVNYLQAGTPQLPAANAPDTGGQVTPQGALQELNALRRQFPDPSTVPDSVKQRVRELRQILSGG